MSEHQMQQPTGLQDAAQLLRRETFAMKDHRAGVNATFHDVSSMLKQTVELIQAIPFGADASTIELNGVAEVYRGKYMAYEAAMLQAIHALAQMRVIAGQVATAREVAVAIERQRATRMVKQ